jgi:ABC-type uncharacterized transport system permease subunit
MRLFINMITTITAFLAITCYAAAGIFIAIRLFKGNGGKQPSRTVGIGLGLAGVILHTVVLYQNIHLDSGINLGFFNAGSLVMWLILLLLMVSSLSKPVENLGIVLLPIAIIAVAMELYFPATRLLPADSSWGLRVHVIISLLAYSLFTLASVQAILLSIQDHHLRQRHPGGFIRALPPLQTMEQLLFEMIGLGFLLLTFALLSGFLFLSDIFAQHLVHKTILSIFAWLVFGILLWGRFRFGWRGRKALIWTQVGFVVLALAYFGSKFVIELLLSS